MFYPLKSGILGLRLNRTLHGRSVNRKVDVPGHNVVRGYNTPGTGDAVDLFGPAGTPVYAVHDGYISRIADPGGRLSCVYIQGKGILTVYAHLSLKLWIRIKNILNPIQQMKAGQCIGYIGRKLNDPHLHFEMWKDGMSVSGRNSKELANKMDSIIKGG